MCCKDLWYLEVEVPAAAARVALVRASTNSLELCWTGTPTAQYYLLEVQKIESEAPPAPLVPISSPTIQSTPPALVSSQVPQLLTPVEMIKSVVQTTGPQKVSQRFLVENKIIRMFFFIKKWFGN